MASGDRTRYYWDRTLECLIEIRDGMNSEGPQKLTAPTNLVCDIENYNAVGIQDPHGKPGDTLVITKGRRQHRDELRARGLIEVGNERSAYAEKPKMSDARVTVREALSHAGFDNGARTFRELKRQGRL
jgi:hypothetical protein